MGSLSMEYSREREVQIRLGKVCPYCRSDTKYASSSAEVYNGKDFGPIFICRPCRAWVGSHKDRQEPMGMVCKSDDKLSRVITHAYFDTLWQPASKYQIFKSRAAAYEAFAREMKLSPKLAHIGCLTIPECIKLQTVCKRLLKEKMPSKYEDYLLYVDFKIDKRHDARDVSSVIRAINRPKRR